MNVELSPRAVKYLDKLNNPLRDRIGHAIWKLSKEPPEGDIRAMAGREGYRLRVGQYRVLFNIVDEKIVVLEIGPRGQIYKR